MKYLKFIHKIENMIKPTSWDELQSCEQYTAVLCIHRNFLDLVVDEEVNSATDFLKLSKHSSYKIINVIDNKMTLLMPRDKYSIKFMIRILPVEFTYKGPDCCGW